MTSGHEGAQPGAPDAAAALSVRAARPDDAVTVERVVVARWGGREIVSREGGARRGRLAGCGRRARGTLVGLATWVLEGDDAELLSLDALVEGEGAGGTLVDSVVVAAVDAGARRVVLSTSNDNVRALAFYQRRGFRIAEVHEGAIDRARELKPAIPLVGASGIEIHDELVLVRALDSSA